MLDRLVRGYQWMHENRRRWLPVVAIIAAVGVGHEVFGVVPREVDVELPMGDEHALITRVEVAYLESDALVHHVSLRFPEGAPERVRHRVELAPGRYVVSVDLVREDGATETRTGGLEAPADGRVRVSLREDM